MLAWVMNMGFAASNLVGPNINWPYYTNPNQIEQTTYNDAPHAIGQKPIGKSSPG